MLLGDQPKLVMQYEHLSLEEVQGMIAKSAISSVRGATRRFHHWFFVYDRDNDRLERMFQHLPAMNGLTMRPHFECNSYGCPVCLWSGEVPI